MKHPEKFLQGETDCVASSPASAGFQHTLHPGANRLSLILTIVFTGFIASLFYHYQMGVVRKKPYPLNTFLFRPDTQFRDFSDNFKNAQTLNLRPAQDRPIIPGIASAPLMLYAEFLYPFFLFHAGKLLSILTVLMFLAAVLYVVRRAVLAVSPDCALLKTLILTLCSYPVLFAVDRANFETTIFILLAGAIFWYRRCHFLLSALAMGAAISAKPYSMVFLPMYFSDRKFKEMFVALFTAAALIWISFCLIPGTIESNLDYFRRSLAAYNEIYVNGNWGLFFGSSLFGLLKVLIYWSKWFLEGADSAAVTAFIDRRMSGYFIFSVSAFAAISTLVCLLQMEFWKKVALLICAMNLLPYVCGDYRLVHFFIPMILFIREKNVIWGDRFFAVIFGLLLIPTGYIHFVFDPVFRVPPLEVSDSVVLHPLLMLALLGGIVTSVLRRAQWSETALWLAGLLRIKPAS